jgi:uncharacterized protein YndB with AHSA1/START domain
MPFRRTLSGRTSLPRKVIHMPVLDRLDSQQLTPDTGISLELTRVIRASKQRVFDAWTRPETIRQWFGPEGYTTLPVKADSKPGGAYEIKMEGAALAPSEELRRASVSGMYTKVDPYDLVQFTWAATWAPDEASLVTIHLRDVDGGTELRLVHERFASEISCKAHSAGWTGAMVKFAKLLEA